MSLWQRKVRRLGERKKGLLLALAGPAKVGKTHALGEVLKAYGPERSFWIAAGEAGGESVATRAAGFGPQGMEAEECRSPAELQDVIESLADSPFDLICLDSLDGLDRWVEQRICAADDRRRMDRATGIMKLDQRGFGLKLNWVTRLVRDGLYGHLTRAGKVVVVTVGIKEQGLSDDGERRSVVGFDIAGSGGLAAPRWFSDVGLVERHGMGRRVVFGGHRVEAGGVFGSRTGFPDLVAVDELAAVIQGSQDGLGGPAPTSAAGAPPPAGSRSDLDDPRKGGVRKRPDLDRPTEPVVGPETVLRAGDFMVSEVKGAEGKAIYDAEEWQSRACARMLELKAEGQLDKVSERDRELVRVAYRVRMDRYVLQIQRLADKLGEEALDKALAHYDITDNLGSVDPDLLRKVRDKLKRQLANKQKADKLAERMSPAEERLAEVKRKRQRSRDVEAAAQAEVDEIMADRDYIRQRVADIDEKDRVEAMGQAAAELGLSPTPAQAERPEWWAGTALSDKQACKLAAQLRSEEREEVEA